jgi:hypothetical protein
MIPCSLVASSNLRMEKNDCSEAPLTPNDHSKRILVSLIALSVQTVQYFNLFVYLGCGILDYFTVWPGKLV